MTKLTQSMVSPSLFDAAKRETIPGIVESERTVRITDDRFNEETLSPPTEALEYQPGTEVLVTASTRWFHCQTRDERAEERYEQRAKQQLDDRATRQRRNEKRDAAAAFWEAYEIPFEFDVAIKGRLSGLSRGSWGSGADERTVQHLYVTEAFSEGRLERPADTFLCEPTASYPFNEERHLDGDDVEYLPQVTCTTCLKRMKRWRVGDSPTQADTTVQ